MPNTWSAAPLRVMASAVGSAVVTSTSNGAKSSATRDHTSRMPSASAVVRLSVPFPAGSQPGEWPAATPCSFQAVPVTVMPSKSRKIVRVEPGRLCSARTSAAERRASVPRGHAP